MKGRRSSSLRQLGWSSRMMSHFFEFSFTGHLQPSSVYDINHSNKLNLKDIKAELSTLTTGQACSPLLTSNHLSIWPSITHPSHGPSAFLLRQQGPVHTLRETRHSQFCAHHVRQIIHRLPARPWKGGKEFWQMLIISSSQYSLYYNMLIIYMCVYIYRYIYIVIANSKWLMIWSRLPHIWYQQKDLQNAWKTSIQVIDLRPIRTCSQSRTPTRPPFAARWSPGCCSHKKWPSPLRDRLRMTAGPEGFLKLDPQRLGWCKMTNSTV